MMIVVCPACGYETHDPEPDWIADTEVVEECCEACAREWYGDDDAGLP
jgi:hypothetical protein